ncbi:hypothetical protein [Phyllobacterium sp. SB3]|uniref:hypothetical protein n=1 Tax=Phyllobacterium sp. SB3 TaxID=3156073 RepID=UPI0032AE961A
MSLIQFAQFGPDRSDFDPSYTNTLENVLPAADSFLPFPGFTPLTVPLPDRPQGTFLAVQGNGVWLPIAATGEALYKLNFTTLGWDNISELTPDIVTNGGFGSDSGWSKDTNVTISGGAAHFTAVANGNGLSQTLALTEGVTYKLSFSVINYSAGRITPALTGGTPALGTVVDADGIYSMQITANSGNVELYFISGNGPTTLDIDSVTLEPLAQYHTPATQRWSFTQYGEWVLATNGVDPVVYLDLDIPTAVFTQLSPNAPRARNIDTVGDFVFVSMLSDLGDKAAQWSGLNDPLHWTPNQRSSDFQVFPDDGEIMGHASFEKGIIIFHEHCIREGVLDLSTPLIFQFQKTVEQHGTHARGSIVSTGGGTFYLSQDGFYKYATPNPIKIGVERVDRFFFNDCDFNETYYIYGFEDPARACVYWAYRSVENQFDQTFDRLLCYNYGIDRWSLIKPDIILTSICDSVTPGYTLELLDNVGNLDDLPFSLDSRAWAGSLPVFAAFDNDNRLGFFSGDPVEARLQTADIALSQGRRTYVKGFTPLTDAQKTSGRVAIKDFPGKPRSWKQSSNNSTVTGTIPARASGLLHRFELTIPSGQSWTHVHGVDVDGNPEGHR